VRTLKEQINPNYDFVLKMCEKVVDGIELQGNRPFPVQTGLPLTVYPQTSFTLVKRGNTHPRTFGVERGYHGSTVVGVA
jgi:hypothetical protein